MLARRSYVTVTGKGGHCRAVPLNGQVVRILQAYRRVRGEVERHSPFFLNQVTKDNVKDEYQKLFGVALQ